jgi:predicted RNase H-like nuclease
MVAATGTPTKRRDSLPFQMVGGVVPVSKGWVVLSARLMGVTVIPESVKVVRTLEHLLDERPAFAACVVDAPIGLPEEPLPDGFRSCDAEARDVLGWPRRIAVSRVPSRAALKTSSLEEVRELEPWVTELNYRKVRAAREMDTFMQPYLQRSIYSGNPELSFFLLNGDQPMKHNHWTHEGVEERLELLRPRLHDIDRFVHNPPRGAGRKHVVDAAGLMWTARRVSGRAVARLPRDPEWDENGIRMELVR